MKTLIASLMLSVMLVASLDAHAMRAATFMTRSMEKFVGQPESLLYDKLGRPHKVDGPMRAWSVSGSHGWQAAGGSGGFMLRGPSSSNCIIEVEINDDKIVRRWAILGNWSLCMRSFFVRLKREKWLKQKLDSDTARKAVEEDDLGSPQAFYK